MCKTVMYGIPVKLQTPKAPYHIKAYICIEMAIKKLVLAIFSDYRIYRQIGRTFFPKKWA